MGRRDKQVHDAEVAPSTVVEFAALDWRGRSRKTALSVPQQQCRNLDFLEGGFTAPSSSASMGAHAGGGPKTSTAFNPPKANEFDMV